MPMVSRPGLLLAALLLAPLAPASDEPPGSAPVARLK
jgi:hypothetical protein